MVSYVDYNEYLFFFKSHNYKLDYKQIAHINVVAVKVGPNYLATKKCIIICKTAVWKLIHNKSL